MDKDLHRKFLDKEAIVREQRTIEAIRKNLTGKGGKFGVIARVLGEKIIRQDTDVDWDEYEEGQILEYDGEESITEEGYLFDGLRMGLHLTIVYNIVMSTIKVQYKGRTIFSEIAGDLECYAPNLEWEQVVDDLFNKAKEKAEDRKESKKEKRENALKTLGRLYLDKFRTQWGI